LADRKENIEDHRDELNHEQAARYNRQQKVYCSAQRPHASFRPMTDVKPKGRSIYKMRVAKIIDHTPLFRELFLEALTPSEFQFRAGQFVMMHVPQETKPALRAYSIASAEQTKTGFQLIFKAVENGVATNFVWALKGDETLDFTGPFGRVFFKEPPTEQIVFLNTGSGIAQHLSFILSHAERFPDLRYRLLFGVRNDVDVYYRDELEAIKSKLKDFQYEYVLSRPTESWSGKKGYIQHYVETFEYMSIPTTFYLCGNGQMIKDVKHLLIESKGFSPDKIHSEAFD
jgi:CDP-4-dehydro-6-deoxyglucose reductase